MSVIDSLYRDSLDSIRRADIEYQRVMDSIVNSYEKERGAIEIEHYVGDNDQTIGMIMAIVTLVVIFGSFIVYNILNNRYWDRGIFPPFMMNRKVNRYEAVVNLGVNILRFDRDNNKDKIAILQRFLKLKFPDITGDMAESYSSALSQPLTTESICKWLKPKIAESERLGLLDMLFAVATSDGKMGQKEYAELLMYCRSMGVSETILSRKTEDHRRKFAEQVHEEQQRRSAFTQKSASTSLRNKYLQILGLKEGFSEVELKKTYRILVKTCHPDMNRKASAGEREQLNQRFLEIQEAYEFLIESIS